jgi:hypothetical protein
MPQMIYLRKRYPRSFLVFSAVGEGYCLRDFSAPGTGPAEELERQSPGRTASEIRDEARSDGYFINVPEQRIDDYAYWHEQTVKFNKQYPPPPSPPPPESWWRKHLREIIVGVVIVIVGAIVVKWMGLNK